MKADTTQIIRAAASIRQFNEQGWKAFVDAFAQYSARMTEECLDAPPERLPQAQAQAKQARALLTIFSTQSTTKG